MRSDSSVNSCRGPPEKSDDERISKLIAAWKSPERDVACSTVQTLPPRTKAKIQEERGILHRFGVVRNVAIPNTLAWLLHRGKALAQQVRSGSIADLLLAGINPLLFESVL